jgi:hypothetical protein
LLKRVQQAFGACRFPAMKLLVFALLLLLVPAVQTSPPGARPISGQVVDENGGPIPGARYRISAYEERSDGEWMLVSYTGLQRVFSTDGEGRFTLSCQAHQRLDLDFDAPGKAPSFHTQIEAGEELKVVLREGLDVAGQVVLASGEAVAHCEVGMLRPNHRGDWFQARTWTDEEGRFEFPAFREDGESWQLTIGRAALPLGANPGEVLDDLLVEIKLSRTGR